jgi:hypothetical protein
MEYIIPPPMEARQCIKILPPDNKHDQPRRCGCNTSSQDLEQARRLSLELMGPTGQASVIERIILLRVCKNSHRTTLKQSESLGSLVEAYQKTCAKTEMTRLQFARRDEEIFERYRPAERGSTIIKILRRPINEHQDEQGSIYIFNWPRTPGFLKIGYAKVSAGKRVSTWQLCHPEATPLYEVDLAFPERMETLIHAELAGKRYRLREPCSRCGKQHTEWFEITLGEAQRVVRDWWKVSASPLYTEDRTLSLEWDRIIGSLSQVTGSTLRQHLKNKPSNHVSRAPSFSEQSKASSPRTSSQREDLVASPSPSLHPQEDKQLNELVEKLDRDLAVNRYSDVEHKLSSVVFSGSQTSMIGQSANFPHRRGQFKC